MTLRFSALNEPEPTTRDEPMLGRRQLRILRAIQNGPMDYDALALGVFNPDVGRSINKSRTYYAVHWLKGRHLVWWFAGTVTITDSGLQALNASGDAVGGRQERAA